MSTTKSAFLEHVCQTSPEPLGVEVARAAGSCLWDTEGNRYLDMLAGIGVANIGHTHPSVVSAVQAQAERYLHCAVYGETIQEPQARYAEKLASVAPAGLSTVYFTNSGAEAVEGAMKTARKHTRRRRFIAFEGAFHGDTFGAMSVGGNPLYKAPFEPLLADVELLPFADEAALARIDESVAGAIIEPVQAEGGVRVPPAGFLSALRQRCNQVGALLLFDEVLTGFGRTGRLFACEHWDVTPDILILAKALGGGMPLGAFIGRPTVMDTLSHDPPLAHVTTFGGHPVSCAAGLAGLEVLLGEGLPERARILGRRWRGALQEFRGATLVDVRGLGLLIGMEFASPEATQAFTRRCFHEGLILNWTLHRDTVVRLVPPLTISDDDLAEATDIFARVLACC